MKTVTDDMDYLDAMEFLTVRDPAAPDGKALRLLREAGVETWVRVGIRYFSKWVGNTRVAVWYSPLTGDVHAQLMLRGGDPSEHMAFTLTSLGRPEVGRDLEMKAPRPLEFGIGEQLERLVEVVERIQVDQ